MSSLKYVGDGACQLDLHLLGFAFLVGSTSNLFLDETVNELSVFYFLVDEYVLYPCDCRKEEK